jgi:hypothetical protein
MVQRYCEALLEKDWARAYAALHPDSRARYGINQFVHLAERYRRDHGFEPEFARIRFCQEQGTRAIAHIMWKGQKAAPSISTKTFSSSVPCSPDGG